MPVNADRLVVGNATITIDATDVGAIKEGITITPTFTVFNVDIEQETFPSRFWYTDKKFTIEFTMCEPTLENIKFGWDLRGTIGGADPRTLDIGTSSGDDFVPTNRAIVATSFTPQAAVAGVYKVRTVTFHKCMLETPGATVFTKRQEVSLKCTFNACFDTAQTPDRIGQFSDDVT